jgi:L-alanine-DL-glutamate epimerase-like enolase superfamily enzyme
MTLALTVRTQRWPIAGAFTIARGAKTEAQVVVAELGDGAVTGRGECVPYARYGETVEGVAAAIEAMRGALADGLDRNALQSAMPAGAARNALDCAFWDFEAKTARRSVHALAGLPQPHALVTAYTISSRNAQAAQDQARRGGGSDAHPRRACGGAQCRTDRRCE